MIAMKTFLFILSATLLLAACGKSPSESTLEANKVDEKTDQIPGNYGDAITEEQTVSVREMFESVRNEGSFRGKVRGEITEVCTHKGCWLGINLPDGSLMRVTFKDYGFFVPTESSGFPVILEGEATVTTTDVKTLKHYAEDAGKSQEEIDAIDSPEENVSFVANGVIILNKS
jgi:hypothetical protein